MSFLQLPWLEIAIAQYVLGIVTASLTRDGTRAFVRSVIFSAAALVCTILCWLNFHLHLVPEEQILSLQPGLFGRMIFSPSELTAPLIPMLALIHFLTALITTRTKLHRFSPVRSLVGAAIRILVFGVQVDLHQPDTAWWLIALAVLSSVPPYFELRARRQATWLYAGHMGLCATLLVAGWIPIDRALQLGEAPPEWSVLMILAAVLIRSGTFPAHTWVVDYVVHAGFGQALLFITPITGAYLAVQLVLPVASEWVLHTIEFVSLGTAVYCSGLAVVQKDVRRFFAYLFLSHASLILVGLELLGEDHGEAISLTGALALWFSIMVSLTGFGLTLRAVEARFGRLTLDRFRGYYEHVPTLAVAFLLTGLASIGFPGTLGFISTELLVDGAIEASPWVGVVVALAAAINSISVLRAYFLLFTGTRHLSSISLSTVPRERLALGILTLMILGGGLYPQPGIETRNRAASQIILDHERYSRQPEGSAQGLADPRPTEH